MRDWEAFVRQHLRLPELKPEREKRIVRELAAQFEDFYRDALARGLTEDEADQFAQRQIRDWEGFASDVRRADRPHIRPRLDQWSEKAEEVARRRGGGWLMFDDLQRDVRYGARMLAKNPGFATVAILTLALGIGANTAIFSVVNGVLLEPLPYKEPRRLVQLWETNREASIKRHGPSSGDVVEWRQRNEVFEGIGAWYVMGRTLRTESEAEIVSVAQVSEDFFPLLRTTPLLGRTFTIEETARSTFNSAAAPTGSDPVVVVSHRLWRRHFGGDPDAVGRRISLERRTWRVVGVMPQKFSMPSPFVDLWIPWSFEGERPRDQRYLSSIARLKPGISLEEAQAHMDAVASNMAKDFPETNEGWGVQLLPLHDEIAGTSRPVLLILLGAVGCGLLIACLNIVGLQLARTGERKRELAIRMALGASRPRLLRQFLVENLLLTFLGGFGGILLAISFVSFLKIIRPGDLPRLDELSMSTPVFLFSAMLTLSIGVVFGVMPALHGLGFNLPLTLKEENSRGITAGSKRQRLRNLLVVSEVALAVVLLAAAGLLVRSFQRLRSVDPGFNGSNVLVLPIFLDNNVYNSGTKTRAYYDQLTQELSALPGVVSVGGATALPASPLGPDFDRPIWAEGTLPPPGGANRADVRMVTPEYFRTLGISLLQGGAFSIQDRPDSPRVTIINQSLADRVWPGLDPVGKHLVVDYSRAGTYPYEVVGVVNDIRFYGLRSNPRPEVYFPHAQRSYLILNMAVRTSVDPRGLIPQVRRAVLEVDPLRPAQSYVLLEDLLAATVARDRFAMLLLTSFAITALLLAALGIFGLLSSTVTQRTHEIGIRMALGAQPRDIFKLVVGQGMVLTLAGVGVGLAASFMLTRFLESLLFGVTATDPVTFSGVAVLLVAVALLACYLPDRRATKVDPMVALRYE